MFYVNLYSNFVIAAAFSFILSYKDDFKNFKMQKIKNNAIHKKLKLYINVVDIIFE